MRFLKLFVTAAVLALVPSSSAMAAPALDGTFTPPSGGTPKQIAQGPDGNLWVVLSGGGKEFARVTPEGVITEYDAPGTITSLEDVTSGPNNHVWFSAIGNVVEVDPANPTAPTAHSVAQLQAPRGIVQGADGNLWVVDTNIQEGVVRVTPAGVATAFEVTGSSGRGITLGSDGRVWWADTFGAGSLRATDTAGVTTTYPGGSAGLQEVAAGPAGQVAFTQQLAQPYELIRANTADGAAQKTVADREPFGIDFGTDGAYWVAEFATHSVGRFTTDGQLTHPIDLPAGSGPRYIAKGPNNTLWVTAETSNKIHRISGVVAEQPQTGGGNTGGGDPVPPPPDTLAPVLTAAKINGKTRSLTLTLDEPARLAIVVERRTAGRRSGRKCVAQTKRNRTGKKCNFWKAERSVNANGVAGANKISLGKKKFAPGTYRARITATDAAGNAAKAKPVSFKVSAPSRKRR